MRIFENFYAFEPVASDESACLEPVYGVQKPRAHQLLTTENITIDFDYAVTTMSAQRCHLFTP